MNVLCIKYILEFCVQSLSNQISDTLCNVFQGAVFWEKILRKLT